MTRIMPIECVVLFELHKLCATFSASVCINYRLPIKVYYRICTLRHIRIEINHGSQNVILSFNMDWRILVNFIPRFLLGIKYEYPPIHIKTPNTFWLPWFISKNKYKSINSKGSMESEENTWMWKWQTDGQTSSDDQNSYDNLPWHGN